MTNTVGNVVAGKPKADGGIWQGPLGSPLPTDASTELDASLQPTGYIGEGGVTESDSRSTTKVRAWGGDTVKVVQTEHSLTYAFTYFEALRKNVLEAIYGVDNVETTDATASAGTQHAVKVTGEQLPHGVFVFEIKDGDARIRIVVPDGQIIETGDITYNDGEVIGYTVTVEAFKDANGAKAYKYMDDGRPTAG